MKGPSAEESHWRGGVRPLASWGLVTFHNPQQINQSVLPAGSTGRSRSDQSTIPMVRTEAGLNRDSEVPNQGFVPPDLDETPSHFTAGPRITTSLRRYTR